MSNSCTYSSTWFSLMIAAGFFHWTHAGISIQRLHEKKQPLRLMVYLLVSIGMMSDLPLQGLEWFFWIIPLGFHLGQQVFSNQPLLLLFKRYAQSTSIINLAQDLFNQASLKQQQWGVTGIMVLLNRRFDGARFSIGKLHNGTMIQLPKKILYFGWGRKIIQLIRQHPNLFINELNPLLPQLRPIIKHPAQSA